MKAKDLTQADLGKWVMVRGKIRDVGRESVKIEFENEDCWSTVLFDTILEFTDPHAPVQEVGDVFSHSMQKDEEWTLAAIALDGKACLLTYKNQHQSSFYPLHDRWIFVRKGTQS
jgi:hypothetical protein